MAKLNSKAKIVALSAVVASTGVVAYASNESAKKDEQQSVDTANLIVEKIGKDRVKVSVDNVEAAVKAFQLSLKIDGNVQFNENSIKWLTTIGNTSGKNVDKPVETDYVLSNGKKEIDIFVASNSELEKQGRVLEICEIDLVKSGARSNSSYKIVPNTENGKVAYKSIDTNNNQVEVANMTYDDTALSINAAPTISLKDPQNDEVNVDVDNKIIKVKEGYDFNSNAKSFVEVNDDEDKNIGEDAITVTDVNTNKSGTHNVEYTVTDTNGESTKLSATVLVEPEVWTDEPIINGIPTDTVELFTGDIFDPLMPDGKNKITATDIKGNSLDVEYTKAFDLETEGQKTITYTAKDKFGNTKTETIDLNVTKDEAPVITGADDKVINKGESFDPKDGVEATDNGQSLTDSITISGSVNINVAKEYKLTYKVSDGRNTTTKARKVTVNGAPTISGNLSDITIKNGSTLTKDYILNRINVSDDIDAKPTVNVDLSNVNTSTDGTYKAKITATDSNNLSTEKEITVVVTSKSVEELPGSGDGKTEGNSIKLKVIDESAIKGINNNLSELTKDYDVVSKKKDNTDEVVYSITVSDKPVAIEGVVKEEWFVDITVPKEIDDKGGIVITQHQGVKVQSIAINGYTGPLKVGESVILIPEINPQDADNKELMWSFRQEDIKLEHYSSTDQSVKITALRDGVTKIRAAAVDGSKVYDEIEVQVGNNVKPDTEKPQFVYDGKTDIKVLNGMSFNVPAVTATDNVDVYTKVEHTIYSVDKNTGQETEIQKIDTTVAGKYKIKYTTEDSAGNKADDFIINVTVDEPITGITVTGGDAATDETALEMESTNVDTLKDIVKAVEKGFDAKTTGKPVINNGKVTYTIKLSKKQGLISRLFNLNKNTETYYIKITVDNKPEFTVILDKFNTDGSITNPPIKPQVIPPSVPVTSVTQLIGEKRFDTAAKISQEGWNTSTNVILVNGNNRNLVDGLTATPLASAKDAPILLSYDDKLPQETIDEIKRLGASNVILIGGESAIPKSVVDQVKAIDSKINVQRIGGSNRYETSLNIAKEIDKTNDITKVYIGAGDGEADSLSISPVAGREKSPIILTKKDGLDTNIAKYLKDEQIKDAYFIGGNQKISDSVVSQVNGITSNDVSKNRIEGERRKDTNAKVIEEFYSNSQLDGVIVAKDLELVDALTVGPLAAKKNIPVVIATDELSKSQEDILNKKKSPKIYETGGGIKSSVVDKLKQLLNNRK